MSQSKRRKAEAAVIEAARMFTSYYKRDYDIPQFVPFPSGLLMDLADATQALDALDLELPGRARSGARHPLTSEQAQVWMEGARAKSAAARIVRYLHGRPISGATVDELIQVLAMPHQTCSPRVTELRNEGWLVDSGVTRPTRAEQQAIVWKLSGTAKALLNAEGLRE